MFYPREIIQKCSKCFLENSMKLPLRIVEKTEKCRKISKTTVRKPSMPASVILRKLGRGMGRACRPTIEGISRTGPPKTGIA